MNDKNAPRIGQSRQQAVLVSGLQGEHINKMEQQKENQDDTCRQQAHGITCTGLDHPHIQ